MKILFVLENYHPNIGGVETLFRNIAENLVNKGHTVSILTNKLRKGIPSRERHGRFTVYRYPFINRYLFTLFAFFPALALSLRHELVHTTSYNAGIPSFFAGMLTRRRVIITFHEVWGRLWFELPFFGKLKLRLHYHYEQLLLRLPFHRFVAVSEFTRRQLLDAGVRADKIIRIYNGIDYDKFDALRKKYKPIENDQFTFLYFGRLGISKGLDVLLRATHLLAQDNSQFKLILILPLRPKSLFIRIMHLIESLSIKNHIGLFHDLSEVDLFEKVSLADCVVIPSYSEGFCFTAVEATALGKPVVCAHKGALKEVVSGKHIFFERQDPTDLYSAMIKAIEGKWCENDRKQFKIEDTVDHYIHLYQQFVRS